MQVLAAVLSVHQHTVLRCRWPRKPPRRERRPRRRVCSASKQPCSQGPPNWAMALCCLWHFWPPRRSISKRGRSPSAPAARLQGQFHIAVTALQRCDGTAPGSAAAVISAGMRDGPQSLWLTKVVPCAGSRLHCHDCHCTGARRTLLFPAASMMCGIFDIGLQFVLCGMSSAVLPFRFELMLPIQQIVDAQLMHGSTTAVCGKIGLA